MYEEQKPLDEKTQKLTDELNKEMSLNYNRLHALEIEERILKIRNNEIYQELRNLNLKPNPIIVTEEQRIRYTEELATDNWKKYSQKR